MRGASEEVRTHWWVALHAIGEHRSSDTIDIYAVALQACIHDLPACLSDRLAVQQPYPCGRARRIQGPRGGPAELLGRWHYLLDTERDANTGRVGYARYVSVRTGSVRPSQRDCYALELPAGGSP